MSRGKKLDIFIGAEINDGWTLVDEKKTEEKKREFEPSKHSLVFKKEKRNGKIVTIVGEFFISPDKMQTILKSIKKELGCGGTQKEGWMEFQGELKDKLKESLLKKGFI
jgi:translation initiation factor 1